MTDTTTIKLALKARYDIQKANSSVLKLLPFIELEHSTVAFLPSDVDELKLALSNIQRFTYYVEAVAAEGKRLSKKEA
ncbi:hypothetical protein [Photobacterium satsumensis]|uniref:hypothetical protein n=1 Tax=Photobacterium satsumensis TaxID=2910239 RepID=UPI003D132F67